MIQRRTHPSLRERLASGQLIRAMAVHSPLSALLAERAGFEALWASGFELSALFGLADLSLISMAEHLAMVRAITLRCGVPLVADIDTGFGNAINVLYAVECYEAAGAAAVVIEDKIFPKVTSLAGGGRQELAPIAEFQGKIAAARSARRSDAFLVIARTEALIAGAGIDEALRRAEAYLDAGPDMIVVHSKHKTAEEIEAFVARWTAPTPLVVIPTAFPQLDVARSRALKIGMVIYGNHSIRACVRAMRDVHERIAQTGGTLAVEAAIASVQEVFALQGMDRIAADEDRFLPSVRSSLS